MGVEVYRTTSRKSVQEFIDSIKANAEANGYFVRGVFNLKEEYERHGSKVDESFNAYQIILCKFNYKSLQKNIKRLAVLLPPKQLVVYSDSDGNTLIEYLPFTKEIIQEALPGDEEFAVNQSNACQGIIKLIEASQ